MKRSTDKMIWWRGLTLALALTGCGGGDPIIDDDGGACLEPPEPYACELSTTVFEISAAECYDIAVPIDWNDVCGPALTLFVKRVPADVEPARAEVWFLAGGPGASSSTIELQMAAVQFFHPDVDLLTLDHRGTHRSTHLACPTAAPDGQMLPENTVACVAEIEAALAGGGLADFSVTAAAYDLDYVMGSLHRSGAERFVWASSYGTYWALRYMLIAETVLNGVFLEAVVPGPITDFPDDAAMEQKLLDMLEICRQDAVCGTKLPDPVLTLEFLKANWGISHCWQLAQPDFNWRAMQQVIVDLSYHRFSQILVAPLLYRMERCSVDDRVVITTLRGIPVGSDAPAPGSATFSAPVHFNIVLSEMLKRSETLAALQQAQSELLIGPGYRLGYAELYDVWPRYTEPLATQWPTPVYPVLLAHGELDPITAIEGARATALAMSIPLVEIPWATHEVLINSPASTPPSSGSGHCAYDVFSAFLADPETPPSPGCLADILPYNWDSQIFKGNDIVALLAQELMGVSDPWEGGP